MRRLAHRVIASKVLHTHIEAMQKLALRLTFRTACHMPVVPPLSLPQCFATCVPKRTSPRAKATAILSQYICDFKEYVQSALLFELKTHFPAGRRYLQGLCRYRTICRFIFCPYHRRAERLTSWDAISVRYQRMVGNSPLVRIGRILGFSESGARNRARNSS